MNPVLGVVRMRWLLAAMLAALVFAGCTENSDGGIDFPAGQPGGAGQGAAGDADARVQLEATAAEDLDGRCFDGSAAFGEECHWITANVTNAGDQDAPMHHWDWDGVLESGGAVTVSEIDGASKVPSGSTATIRFGFTTDLDAPHVVTLRFTGDISGVTVEGDVPAY